MYRQSQLAIYKSQTKHKYSWALIRQRALRWLLFRSAAASAPTTPVRDRSITFISRWRHRHLSSWRMGASGLLSLCAFHVPPAPRPPMRWAGSGRVRMCLSLFAVAIGLFARYRSLAA